MGLLYARGLIRIILGLLFLQHGLSKLIGFPPMDLGAMPEGLKIAAGLIETVGGGLLIVGFATRPVAFVMSGFAAAAYFMAHFPRGFFPALNGGDAAILFCFAALHPRHGRRRASGGRSIIAAIIGEMLRLGPAPVRSSGRRRRPF